MKEIIVIRHGEKNGDLLTPEGIQACSELAGRIGTQAAPTHPRGTVQFKQPGLSANYR